jgi:ribosomal protein S8
MAYAKLVDSNMSSLLHGYVSGFNRDSKGNQFSCILPYSKKTLSFCRFLFTRGWIRHYYVDNNNNKLVVRVLYKYYNARNTFYQLKIISSSGDRSYCTYKQLFYLCRKHIHCKGIYYVLRTSRGYLSSDEALSQGIGGELVGRIFY